MEGDEAGDNGWQGGSNVLVKVCGITRVEDALVGTQAGVSLIGTIFCPSKRQVTPQQSHTIVQGVRKFGERTGRVLPYTEQVGENVTPLSSAWFVHWKKELLRVTRRTPLVVGVFQNNTVEEIVQAVEASEVDLVQLHGDETAEFAAQVSRATGVPCIKVLHIPHEGAEAQDVVKDLTDSSSVNGGPIAILLDTAVGNQKGGSGVQFDWKLASTVQQQGYPVIIAGGLLPTNVEEVLRVAQPFGVDISSGVEEKPGIKDHSKVTDFVGRVRAFK